MNGLIRIAMNACVVKQDPVQSVYSIDEMYNWAGFNENAAVRRPWKGAMDLDCVEEQFHLVKALIAYEYPKDVITEPLKNCEYFISKLSVDKCHPATSNMKPCSKVSQ